MSEASRAAGPWRAASYLLLAWALVQADAHPPRDALVRFGERRVLPVARALEARVEPWLPAVQARLEALVGRERGREARRLIERLVDR